MPPCEFLASIRLLQAQEKANSNSHAKESLGCGFQLAQDEEWDEWDELQPQDLDAASDASDAPIESFSVACSSAMSAKPCILADTPEGCRTMH